MAKRQVRKNKPRTKNKLKYRRIKKKKNLIKRRARRK